MPKHVKALFAITDALLLLISPLAIIGFIVGALIFAINYGEHQSYVRDLIAHGHVTEAQLSTYVPGEPYIAVQFRGDNGEPRYGTIRTAYYSQDVLNKLNRRETIRYLPEVYESSFVLEGHFSSVKHYTGNLLTPLVLMAIAWVIVVIKPEFLYIGFDKSLNIAFPIPPKTKAE